MVAKEYLRRCQLKKWEKNMDEDALRCWGWNLDMLIEAELFHKPNVTNELTLAELEGEEAD